jgi:hypothetical protein
MHLLNGQDKAHDIQVLKMRILSKITTSILNFHNNHLKTDIKWELLKTPCRFLHMTNRGPHLDVSEKLHVYMEKKEGYSEERQIY